MRFEQWARLVRGPPSLNPELPPQCVTVPYSTDKPQHALSAQLLHFAKILRNTCNFTPDNFHVFHPKSRKVAPPFRALAHSYFSTLAFNLRGLTNCPRAPALLISQPQMMTMKKCSEVIPLNKTNCCLLLQVNQPN